MVLEITHNFESEIEDEADESLIKPSNWNENHKIKNLLGYELVEEKTLEAETTTTTFDELDGNADREYLIEGDISIVASGGDRYLLCLMNSISADQSCIYQEFGADGNYTFNGVYKNRAGSYIYLTQNGWSSDSDNRFEAKVYCKTSKRKVVEVKGNAIISAARNNKQQIVGVWDNINDNLTSIQLVISGGSFSGIIRLWKKLPIS